MFNLQHSSAPTLSIAYRPSHQSILAYFSVPGFRNFTWSEQAAMFIIENEFNRQMQQFAHVPVSQQMFAAVEVACRMILNDTYAKTGIRFELNARDLNANVMSF